jgi:hypothetical protein
MFLFRNRKTTSFYYINKTGFSYRNEGSDSSPLTPVDSIQEEFYTFDDLLAAKK